MTRKETLNTAETCVCGQREQDYGSPEDNFRTIAEFWMTYLKRKCIGAGADVCVEPEDVANMMALLKIGRMTTGIPKADNYVDGCGYLACAAEIATAHEEKQKQSDLLAAKNFDAIRQAEQLCAERYNTKRCKTCQVGRNANLEQISCRQYIEFYPELAVEMLEKEVG